MEGAKQKEREAERAKDQRDRPVEEEGDKDLKEGGMEQTGEPRSKR
jgi:hypothetical protein